MPPYASRPEPPGSSPRLRRSTPSFPPSSTPCPRRLPGRRWTKSVRPWAVPASLRLRRGWTTRPARQNLGPPALRRSSRPGGWQSGRSARNRRPPRDRPGHRRPCGRPRLPATQAAALTTRSAPRQSSRAAPGTWHRARTGPSPTPIRCSAKRRSPTRGRNSSPPTAVGKRARAGRSLPERPLPPELNMLLPLATAGFWLQPPVLGPPSPWHGPVRARWRHGEKSYPYFY